jgi:hypothetical protein
MKRLTILTLLTLICSIGFTNDENDKRLEAFVGKLEKFYKNKEMTTTNWRMPNANPESNMDNMHTGNISFYDPETGLEYSPSSGKIFDAKLNIELDVVTGIVYDFKTKKEYSLSDLQSQKSNSL